MGQLSLHRHAPLPSDWLRRAMEGVPTAPSGRSYGRNSAFNSLSAHTNVSYSLKFVINIVSKAREIILN